MYQVLRRTSMNIGFEAPHASFMHAKKMLNVRVAQSTNLDKSAVLEQTPLVYVDDI